MSARPDSTTMVDPRTGPLAGKHLLLVDDNQDVHRFVTGVARLEGATVTSAMDVEEGLRLLHSGAQFDVLLLDINMPGQSGWELLRMFREGPEFADQELPVIVFSASNILGSPLAELYNVALILTKPISASELVRAITSVVRQ